MKTKLMKAAQQVINSWEKGNLAGAVNRMRAVLEKMEPATKVQKQNARALYGSDNIEIDEDALASDPKDGSGYWVSAWVWVSED